MLIPRVPFPKVPTAVFFAMADALPRGRMPTPVAHPALRPVTLGDPGPPPVPPAECGAPAASGPIALQEGRAGIQAPVGALQESGTTSGHTNEIARRLTSGDSGDVCQLWVAEEAADDLR